MRLVFSLLCLVFLLPPRSKEKVSSETTPPTLCHNQTPVCDHWINVRNSLTSNKTPSMRNKILYRIIIALISFQFNHSFIHPQVPFQSLCPILRAAMLGWLCVMIPLRKPTPITLLLPPPFVGPSSIPNALKQNGESPRPLLHSSKSELFAAYGKRRRRGTAIIPIASTSQPASQPPEIRRRPPTSEPQGPTSFIIDRIRQKETEN